MPPPADPPRSTDVQDGLTVLRRRWRWALVPVVVAVALAGALTSLQDPVYEAETQIAVQAAAATDALDKVLFGTVDAATQVEVIQSRRLVEEVLRANGTADPGDLQVRDFLDSTRVALIEGTTVIDLRVRAPSARRAASLARGLAEEYISAAVAGARERAEEAIRELEVGETATRSRLRSVESQLANPTATGSAVAASLQEERDQLYASLRLSAERRTELRAASAFKPPAEIIQPAAVPNQPVSPKPARNLGLGLVLGGLVGVASAFARDRYAA